MNQMPQASAQTTSTPRLARPSHKQQETGRLPVTGAAAESELLPSRGAPDHLVQRTMIVDRLRNNRTLPTSMLPQPFAVPIGT
jgi:hypothetical protein